VIGTSLFLEHNINAYIYTCMSIYFYQHIYYISMSISERLSRFDLKIYEVGHQECLVRSFPIERIINHKYNIHIKFRI
jgi:hypothetical protein